MSTDQGGFGGPKKPKATFGDVMLGIPSGGKDRDGGGKGKPKGKDKKAPPPQDDDQGT